MTDQHADLDAALERVIEAARRHLTAVKAADGRIDDDDVWQAYVDLNNASYEYDELLLDAYGEVTPWDVESIDAGELDQGVAGLGGDGAEPDDAHPHVISVRQRRDYRVPSVSALVQVAEAARRSGLPDDEEEAELAAGVESVGDAVLELLQAGDGSLGALDIPELEPLDGVVMVSEVTAALDLETFEEDDAAGPFQPGSDDRLVGRLDEHPFLALDPEEDLDESELDSDPGLDDSASGLDGERTRRL